MSKQEHRITSLTQEQFQKQTRGQLILIGAVTMGVLIIALTLIINGVLFAQNIESAGIPAEVRDIESTQHLIQTEYGELLLQSNIHNPSPRSNYQTAVLNAQPAIRSQEAAAQGRSVTISQTEQTPGRLFRQTTSDHFTDTNGTDWNITTSDVRRFQVAVNQSSLKKVDSITTSALNQAFHIVVQDTSGTEWVLYVATENESDTIVAVDNGSGPTKQYDAGPAVQSLTIDVVTGSVKKSSSSTVDEISLYNDGFASNLDPSSTTYNITFRNSMKAEGVYTLTARNNSDLDVNGTLPNDKPVVYDAHIDVTYESAEYYYAGQFRIAPCSQTATTCRSYIRVTGDA